MRCSVWKRCIEAVILTKTDHEPMVCVDRETDWDRNVAERTITRLTQWRWIATGHEKRAADDQVMLTLAALQL